MFPPLRPKGVVSREPEQRGIGLEGLGPAGRARQHSARLAARPPFHLGSSFLPGVSLSVCLWVCLRGLGRGNKGGVSLWAARIGQTFFENGPLSKGLLVGSQTDDTQVLQHEPEDPRGTLPPKGELPPEAPRETKPCPFSQPPLPMPAGSGLHSQTDFSQRAKSKKITFSIKEKHFFVWVPFFLFFFFFPKPLFTLVVALFFLSGSQRRRVRECPGQPGTRPPQRTQTTIPMAAGTSTSPRVARSSSPRGKQKPWLCGQQSGGW